MTTNRPPKVPTKWPPRGMSYEFREGKAKPFLARWRHGGVKQSQAFEDAKDRDAFARDWAEARKELGRKVAILNPATSARWAEFERLTAGADLIEVARFWQANHAALEGSLPVEEARKRYDVAQAGRQLARDTITHRKLHLDRFVGAFKGRPVGKVTSTEIAAWLAGLKNQADEPAAPKSRAHHRANVGKLFAWLVVERLADRNPVDAVPVPNEASADQINVLTLAQAQKLFAVNRDALCVGRLALEAFAGLRYSSAARLEYADIIFAEKGIILPASKHKSGQRVRALRVHNVAYLWPRESFNQA